VFLNSHRQVTLENAIKQKSRGETDIEISVDFLRIFSEKVFDMDFLLFVYRVFELPLLRSAQKRLTKKSRKIYFGVGWFLES
jgi:hypothetical protein